MAEGVEGEDVSQLDLVVTGYLLLQVVYLVFEPFLVIVTTLPLLLEVFLHLFQTFLGSQKCLLVVFVLCFETFDLSFFVLVVSAPFGLFLAIGVLNNILVFPLEELFLFYELVLGSRESLAMMDQ